MKTCDEIKVLLATRKDLAPAQESLLQAHLAACSACAAHWQREEQVSRTLGLLRSQPPEGLEYAVAQADQRIARGSARAAWRPPRLLAGALIGAAAFVFVLLGTWLLAPGDLAMPGQIRPSSAPSQESTSTAETPQATRTPAATAARATPAPPTEAQDEQAVRQLVEQFGQQLHYVSLLAPADVLAPALQKHYGPFVSTELLERWVQYPQEALGRLTSSQWPAEIKVRETRRISEAEYLVAGMVIEVTGPDREQAEITNRTPIQLRVERRQDRWLITDCCAQTGGVGAEPAAEADVSAAQTILNYYSAIDQRRYEEAYLHWKDNGAASGQSLGEFQAGYQSTVRVRVILNAVRSSSTGAQSVDVETSILAIVEDPSTPETGQRAEMFSGAYTLEPAASASSATGWVIASANIQKASSPLPPREFASAEQTLTTYYEAIDRQSYARAYSAWDQFGQASGQSFGEFQQGFASTTGVTFEQGAAQMSAGAGSVYARIPVVVLASAAGSSQQAYCGFYNLQRANHPPFDQLGWRIQKGQLVATEPVSLNSEGSRLLLEGGCPAR